MFRINKKYIFSWRIEMSDDFIKKNLTIACCGIDCGMCSRYRSDGESRCPGCGGSNFLEKHPSCGILTCCVKKHHFETCADCSEFPCPRMENWDIADSFVSHKNALSNLNSIKEGDLTAYLEKQAQRMQLLTQFLDDYDEGRSKSMYCLATTLLSLEGLEQSLNQAGEKLKANGIDLDDKKSKAKILKEVLRARALEEQITLKLRTKKNTFKTKGQDTI